MNVSSFIPLLLIGCLPACAMNSAIDKSSENADQDNIKDISYSYGFLLGKAQAKENTDIDVKIFAEGFKDGLAGQAIRLDESEIEATVTEYQQRKDSATLKKHQLLATENAKIEQQFLKDNATKAGVVTTESGLQYLILTAGNGKKPDESAKVKVLYEGRLLDGTVFDSAIARGQPITLAMNEIIDGWTEGLKLMPEGAKYRLFVPAKLAFAEIGAGDAIPPNSTLIFDIELLEVVSEK